VAYVPLGGFHVVAALAIAVTKATLIVLFFMHGLESGRLVHLIILGALLWLFIMLGLTWSDYYTRGVDRRIRTGQPVNVAPR
jgi:cytochrome c oxidase subunit 4